MEYKLRINVPISNVHNSYTINIIQFKIFSYRVSTRAVVKYYGTMETNEQVKISTPEDEDSDSWRRMGFGSKVKYVFRNITVEPLLAFYQVSSVLSSLTTQNLNLQKACRVNLQMDDDVCYGLENKNLSLYADQEVQVQQLVADMLIWQTMIQSSIPCILVIFIGSWSDRNRKRKPCMLVPVIGEIVRNIGLLLCVYYFSELRMEVAGLVESIPTSMAGGLTVLYLAAFSYMGDISSVSSLEFSLKLRMPPYTSTKYH